MSILYSKEHSKKSAPRPLRLPLNKPLIFLVGDIIAFLSAQHTIVVFRLIQVLFWQRIFSYFLAPKKQVTKYADDDESHHTKSFLFITKMKHNNLFPYPWQLYCIFSCSSRHSSLRFSSKRNYLSPLTCFQSTFIKGIYCCRVHGCPRVSNIELLGSINELLGSTDDFASLSFFSFNSHFISHAKIQERLCLQARHFISRVRFFPSFSKF